MGMEQRKKWIDREFRVQARSLEDENGQTKELWAEGYAVRFNSPTVLFVINGTEYKEQIDDRPFEE